MDKLAVLKETLGEERFNEVLTGLTEKEKTALGLGLTPKETETAETQTQAKETDAGPTPVDVEKLTEAVAHVLKPLADEIATIKTQVEATSKEAKGLDKVVEALTAIQTKLGEIETTAKNAEKGVTELKGDLPRSTAKTLRASESDKTVTQKEIEGAKQDPQFNFLTDFVLSHVAQE